MHEPTRVIHLARVRDNPQVPTRREFPYATRLRYGHHRRFQSCRRIGLCCRNARIRIKSNGRCLHVRTAVLHRPCEGNRGWRGVEQMLPSIAVIQLASIRFRRVRRVVKDCPCCAAHADAGHWTCSVICGAEHDAGPFCRCNDASHETAVTLRLTAAQYVECACRGSCYIVNAEHSIIAGAAACECAN